MVGLIHQRASPVEIAKQTIQDAAYMCRRTHGDAPEVTIHGRTDLTFPYVPSHISYILLELLKNSMRATVELHGTENNLPPIRLIIADGEDNEDVRAFLFLFVVLFSTFFFSSYIFSFSLFFFFSSSSGGHQSV
jgi:hypothetical protein